MSSPSSKEVVIIGGGIIGLCTAYYLLSTSDVRVTIIENVSVAYGASSRAAGFIGGGAAWHKEGNQALAALSWAAFEELAAKFDGGKSYGYRHCAVTGVRVGKGQDEMHSYRQLPGGTAATSSRVPWYNGESVNIDVSGRAAQLDPAAFCARIHAEATRLGLRTLIAQPFRRRGKVLETSAGMVPYDRLLIAAGPWSADVCQTLNLPRVPVGSLPGTHVVLAPGRLPEGYDGVPAESLMCGIGAAEGEDIAATVTAGGVSGELSDEERQRGWTRTIEYFPRPDGTVYAAGENAIPAAIGDAGIDSRVNRLPVSSRDVYRLVDGDLVGRMLRASAFVSPALDIKRGATLLKADFCFRPVTEDTMPVLGEWARDVFVAAGHGPWGITLAPGTGIVMAELILADLEGTLPKDVRLSTDISGLSPFRFRRARL